MAVYAIGDLQGCHDALLCLLDKLNFDPAADHLWFTGDLVARGPDSLGVLRTVRALGEGATVVLGNHDLHLLALAWAADSPRKHDQGLRAVLEARDADELLQWLAQRPLIHHDVGLGWTLVHAGLVPQWSVAQALALAAEVEAELRREPQALLAGMYGDEPDLWHDQLQGMARHRLVINALTRMRYVDDQGRLLLKLKGAPSAAPAGALPWFRHPQRQSRGDRLVFGHWSTLGLLQEPGLLGLDGGYVWGGSLWAVRLDAEALPLQVASTGTPAAKISAP